MTRLALSVSANENLGRPVVYVWVLGPSWAVLLTSSVSCLSDRPPTDGTSVDRGCSAAASSLTAGAGALGAAALVIGPLGRPVPEPDPPPQAASARPPASAPIHARPPTSATG